MPIPIQQEPEPEPPYEQCVFCGNHTSWWTNIKRRSLGNQVACCPNCASSYAQREVPTKTEWMKKPRFDKGGRLRLKVNPLCPRCKSELREIVRGEGYELGCSSCTYVWKPRV